MSNWDNLYVVTTFGADQVMDIFWACLPTEAKTGIQEFIKTPMLAVIEVDSTVIDVHPAKDLETAFKNLEILPTIELTFDTKRSVAHDYLYLATLNLIHKTGWDIVYARDDGIIILTCIKGELIIKQDDIFLTEERLKMIDMPYKTSGNL